MRNYDLEFLKRFSMVIGFLMLLTLALIVGAFLLHKSQPLEESTTFAQARYQRIAPAGDVYAGATGAAAQQAAAAAAAARAKSEAAYGGTLDGAVIFSSLCAGCHKSGAGGAPTLARADWTARIAQGNETLYLHAIEGYTGAAGVMPARGGNPGLTDEQVKASVDWILANLE